MLYLSARPYRRYTGSICMTMLTSLMCIKWSQYSLYSQCCELLQWIISCFFRIPSLHVLFVNWRAKRDTSKRTDQLEHTVPGIQVYMQFHMFLYLCKFVSNLNIAIHQWCLCISDIHFSMPWIYNLSLEISCKMKNSPPPKVKQEQ